MSDSRPADFTPVPLRARRDGWTPATQRRFIALLRSGLRPSAAASACGRTKQTAYALRSRPGADSFCAAWDKAVEAAGREAIARSMERPSQYERAVIGIARPIIYRGRKIGEQRVYDDRALITLLGRLRCF